jgi:hypothetical protein
MLHKNHDHNGFVAKKNSSREPEGAWRQDEMNGDKTPVVK